VVNNINQEATILKNNTAGAHYLQLRLQGPPQNRFGLGAELTLYSRQHQQKYHQAVTRGYQSSVDYTVHFGLGRASQVDSLVVAWPDGRQQVWRNPPVDTVLQLQHRQAGPARDSRRTRPATWLQDISALVGVSHVHQEVPYLDFNMEPLLLHKLSQQGPRLAVGDVNGDGLEDFFTGGSYRHYGKLFLQTAGGKFRQKSYTDESRPKDEEDVGVQLLDVDGDEDLDLYLVSGSNEYYDGSPHYQDRLYLNDGRAGFSPAPNQLPPIRNSGSCLAAADFDRDGDLDVFRGGRLRALHYSRPGESLLLENHQGSFREVTDLLAPGLKTAGMVTDAAWVDVDRDGWPDLVVVGEFMPVTLYRNTKGKLARAEAEGLAQSNGLWNCVRAADFDGDGDLDLALGNLGRNSRYRMSATEPLSVHGADYDGNGRYDAIPSYYLGGRQYPIPSREELGRQLPLIKRRYTSYGQYAKALMSEVLPAEQAQNAAVLYAYRQESVLLENTGRGFALKVLPPEAQWAPIQSMWADDINEDGRPDLLAVGNAYGTEPVAGQYDAFTGLLLQGTGKGTFTPLLFPQSGFLAEGDARSVVAVKTAAHGTVYVVASNKGPLQFFRKHPDRFGR
jgi:enediyne biosynthesis protein E4